GNSPTERGPAGPAVTANPCDRQSVGLPTTSVTPLAQGDCIWSFWTSPRPLGSGERNCPPEAPKHLISESIRSLTVAARRGHMRSPCFSPDKPPEYRPDPGGLWYNIGD